MSASNKEAVILVHGIWMKGFEFFYLRYKLKQQGYRVYTFRYSSVFKTPEQNAKKLYQFASAIDESTLHFIAHSLGGIILQHLFYHYEFKQTGKVVMIATPLNGSAVADYLSQKKILKYLLGKSIVKGLLGNAPAWSEKIKTCMIAGTQSIGIGLLLAPKALQKPNDGTVNLYETKLEQAIESYKVKRSHFTLLFSKEVVDIILSFLKK